MKFVIENNLLIQAKSVLSKRKNIYWIVGGAGSGKTTVCEELSRKFDMFIYDMDAHIYGAYHNRFIDERHPVNKKWSTSENGLAWLLGMTWEEFNNFNQAALPEYIDLLVEDIEGMEIDTSLIIDGGISNPSLVAQVIPSSQIVCLATPDDKNANIWETSEDRKAMKKFIYQLPEPEKAWQKFLEFDNCITRTILEECDESGIAVCTRRGNESVVETIEKVGQVLAL